MLALRIAIPDGSVATMPFDGTDFIRRDEPPPAKPSRSENALTILILVLALSLLVFPVSAAGLVDLVTYIRGN